MKNFFLLLAIFGMTIALPLCADDARLYGPWDAIVYTIDGTEYPMKGIVIFTKKHFSSNVMFNMTDSSLGDSNHNAGLYEADGTKLIFKQQLIQIHIRPGNDEEPIELPNKPYEETSYQLKDNRLLIIFPSKNQFILKRIHE